MGTLRLLLALCVVVNHGGGINGFYPFPGSYAVQVFYLISGFLIAFILAEKYGTERKWLFYSNRALRIYIPYFFVWISTLLLPLLVLSIKGYSFGSFPILYSIGKDFSWLTWVYVCITNTVIFGQDLGLFLGYKGGDLYFTQQFWTSPVQVNTFQVLPQSWSMSVELMFYLLAPFLLRLSSFKLIAIIISSLAIRAIAFSYGLQGDPWLYRFFPFELALFLSGAIAYRVYANRHTHRLVDTAPAVIYVGTIFSIGLVLGYYPPIFLHGKYFVYTTSWGGYPWGLFACLALSLPLLFHFSKRWAWDRTCGDLSYPAYLIHWPILTLMPLLMPQDYQKNWQGLAVAITTVFFSILFTLYVEKPLDKLREQRVKRSLEGSRVA